MKRSRFFKFQQVMNKIFKPIFINLHYAKSSFINPAQHMKKENMLSITLIMPTMSKNHISL